MEKRVSTSIYTIKNIRVNLSSYYSKFMFMIKVMINTDNHMYLYAIKE